MNTYYPNTQITLQGVFKSTAAVEVDPTTCRLLYQPAGGSVTAVEMASLTKATTGTYQYVVTPTSSQSGQWVYRFKSNIAGGEEAFMVETVSVST